MVYLWLRNEIFDGVLPLKNLGALHVPSASAPPTASENTVLTSLMTLSKTLRLIHPKMVGYTSWVAEGWRVLHWREPAAKILWEMLALYFEMLNSNDKKSSNQGSNKRLKHFDKNLELPITSLILFLFLHLHPEALSNKPSNALAIRDSPWQNEEPGAGLSSPRSPSRFNVRYSFPSSPGSQSPRGPSFGMGVFAGGGTSPVSPHHTRSLRLQTRSADEANRLAFVKRQLLNLLWLVTAKGNDAEEIISQQITRADLTALSFLVAGGNTLEESHPQGLSDLCPPLTSLKNNRDNQRGRGKRGKNTTPPAPNDVVGTALDVCSWMAMVLTVNDILYPIPPWPSLGVFDSNQNHDNLEDNDALSPPKPLKKAGIFEPTRLLEPLNAGTPIIANSAARTTVHFTGWPEAAPDRDVHVSHCTESYVYILAPSRHASILGCVDCTIVLGPAAGLVRLEECLRVTLVVACHRICVVNNCECTVYLYSPARPVFMGDNRSCTLAPYNTTYPNLLHHLAACNLLASPPLSSPPARNLWASPIDLNSVTSATAAAVLTPRAAARAGADEAHPHVIGGSAAVTQMPPEIFNSISVPLPGIGEYTAVKNPFPLPPEYVNALKDREMQIQQLQQAVQSANLLYSQQRELEEAIRGQFADWLVSSGHIRQVIDLVQLERGPGSPSGQDDDPQRGRGWTIFAALDRGSPAG